jgi:hypothetical protein
MSGNYSIGGSGADFPTLQSALEQLNSEGQSANVNLYLNAGSYEGPFVISRPGSSFNLVLTAVGDAEVNLTNPSSSAETNYILKIDNSSNIFISKLRFHPAGSYSRSVAVYGNSDELTFQNNMFFNSVSTTAWNNEAISFYSDGSEDADNISFELNSFYNGGYHIFAYPNSSLTNLSGWSFYANGHTGGYGAIYLKQTEGIDILGEIIYDSGSGITLEQCGGELVLQRCNVYARTSGISVSNSNFSASVTPQIYNNTVKMSGTNSYNPSYDSDACGISVYGSNIYLAHNSVNNLSRTTGSIALGLNGSNLVAKNNNLLASGNGMAVHIYNPAGVSFEHNNLFTDYLNLARINNTYCHTLAEFSALAGGTNYSVDPLFDNQLKTASPWLDNLGLPCGLASDFNNNPRDPNTPDIGAHEYSSDPTHTPFSGTVSVGLGQTFETFAGLFGELALRGINGDLNIVLCDSLYTEQFEIKAIPGSDMHYIVVQPLDRTSSVIRFSDQTSAANYLIYFTRTSKLSFQNICFETYSSSYSNLLLFEGYNFYPRFLFCQFRAPQGSAGNSIVTPYGSQTPELDVLGCDFFGNYAGISHTGDDSTLGSNLFYGQNTGVSLNQSSNCIISGNGFTDCSAYSIQVNGGKGLNILRNTSNGPSTGIYLSNLELNGTQRNLIANNSIKANGSNMRYGISLAGNGINLINNTFQVTGTNSYGLYSYQPGTNIDIVNNIFVSEQAQAVEFTYFSPSADMVIDYNCYFSPSNFLARFGGYYSTLAELQSAYPTLNQHSISYNPQLSEDLHTQSPWLRRVGIFRSEITTDMDNEPRGELFDIGADQQTGDYGFTPLSGSYNIGLGGQYPTLQAFLSELSILGASSSVTARLLPGIHTGFNVISDFPRISNDHYLTIKALSGASFQIEPQSGGVQNYIFRLDGVDRVIFEDLSLSATSYLNQSSYLLLNGKCDDIKLLNCSFVLGTGYNYGIYATNSINEGLWIEGCQFTGGDRAISLQGSGYTSDLYQSIRVEGNSFNACHYPIEISRANDLKLIHNNLSNFSTGISLSYIYGNSDIIRNSLISHNSAGSYSSATMMSLDNLNGTADQYIEILTNIIYSANNAMQSLNGLSLNNSSYVRLYHNTVSVENSYPFEYGAAYSQSNSNHTLQVNNVFASVRTGYAIYSANCSENIFSNNAYYSGGKNLISLNYTIYEPLSGMSALSDVNGVFANPYVDINGYTTASYLGDKGSASYIQSDINGVVFGSNIPLGASFVAYQEPLSGSIQIGSAFPDLASALNAAMLRGIYGATALLIPAGTYNVSSEIGYIPNTLQNSFSISSNAGAVLVHDATSEADNHILKLRNLRNFNLYGISFTPQNASFAHCVVFDRYNADINIEDCSFGVSQNSNTSVSGAAVYAYSEAYDNLSVVSCDFSNFAFGVDVSASNSNPFANGLLIEHNSFHNVYSAITAYYANAAIIQDNTISAYRAIGLNLAYGSGNLQVLRNRISGSGNYAFSLVQHSEGSPLIANNYLQNANPNGSYTFSLDSVNACRIYFNTLVCASNYGSSAAFYQSGGVGQLQFVNNICKAESGKGAVFQNASTLQRYDHNLFYSSSGSAAIFNGSDINSLTQWSALTGDNSCVFADPLLDGESYDLGSASPAINAGIELAGFGYDIDGSLREMPDLGCREYNGASLGSPTNLQLSYDALSSEMVLSWSAVPGAAFYRVYSADNPEMNNETVSSVAGTVVRFPASQPHRFHRVSAAN